MQETWIQSLVQEDPTCHGAIKPVCTYLAALLSCEILIPQAGIEPRLPEIEAWNPLHWTAREVPAVLCHHSSS